MLLITENLEITTNKLHPMLIQKLILNRLRINKLKTETFSHIGVRAGEARGAAVPPNFGQLRFFGQQEKIWAKLFFKDVSVFFISFKRQIFSILV